MASYKVRRRYKQTSVLDTGTTARRYYKYGTLPNVDIFGDSVTIKNGIASGFTTSSFIITRPQTIIKYTPNASSWELVWKINFTLGAQQTIWACGNTGYYSRLRINTAGKLLFQGGNSSSSYNVFNITGTSTLVGGTNYWIKAEFTGSAYNLYSSTDGQTWTLEGTKASTTKITYGGAEIIGMDYGNTDYPLLSSLDLKECYYKIDGEYFWRGIQPEIATENDYDYYEEYKVVSTYCPDYIQPEPTEPIEPEEEPTLPSGGGLDYSLPT